MQTRKLLTLPSGAQCVIRKLCGMDFLNSREVPQIFGEGGRVNADAKEDSLAIERGVQISKLCLLRACSPLTMPDKRRLKIVDKELDEANPGELTIGEMDDADASAIVQAVLEITQMNREAATKIAPFPEEQAATGGASPSGEDLRKVAGGNLETAVR